jgi:hypothetical protein
VRLVSWSGLAVTNLWFDDCERFLEWRVKVLPAASISYCMEYNGCEDGSVALLRC